MKTLRTFSIHANGQDFGTYEASDAQGARNACAIDAGYSDEADMIAQLKQPSDLVARATTFTYEKVTYNSVKGWIVTMRVDGVFAGKSFGRTRAAAVEKVQNIN